MKYLLIVPVFLLSACCSVERQAIERVERAENFIIDEYRSYVQANKDLSAEQKDDREKLIENLHHALDALKKAAK